MKLYYKHSAQNIPDISNIKPHNIPCMLLYQIRSGTISWHMILNSWRPTYGILSDVGRRVRIEECQQFTYKVHTVFPVVHVRLVVS